MKPRHQILFHQLDSYRSEVSLVLETLTEDTADIITSGEFPTGLILLKTIV